MKKYVLLLAVTVGMTASSFAQKEKDETDEKDGKREKVTVPSAVKGAFAKQFPGLKASWVKEGAAYEAGFKKNGAEMSAVFDAKGAMLESEVDIKNTELPAAVIDYIKLHYKGAAIREAAKITKAGGEVNYEAEVNGNDVIFDAAGKFIKERKE